jgi:hypothetical protein
MQELKHLRKKYGKKVIYVEEQAQPKSPDNAPSD